MRRYRKNCLPQLSVATNGMRFHLGQDHRVYADFFKKKGDLAQAREKLQTAIDIFRKCGGDGWVTKYEEELARL